MYPGLTGNGSLTVSGIVGVLCTLTAVPNSVSIQAGTPPRLRGAGRLTPGTPDGWLEDQSLQHTPQVLWTPSEYTSRIGYSLSPGVVASVQLLHGAASSGSVSVPADRTPVAVHGTFSSDLGPHGSVQRLTYTVPTGKRLQLTGLHVSVSRWTSPSTPGYVLAYFALNGVTLALAAGQLASAADQLVAPATAVGMVLTAGQVLTAYTYNAETGGRVMFITAWTGFVYDA